MKKKTKISRKVPYRDMYQHYTQIDGCSYGADGVGSGTLISWAQGFVMLGNPTMGNHGANNSTGNTAI